jgi:hypothetical protein
MVHDNVSINDKYVIVISYGYGWNEGHVHLGLMR